MKNYNKPVMETHHFLSSENITNLLKSLYEIVNLFTKF